MHPFSRTILDWYACNGRDLPWRRTQDPYAVWLSEIILQQTRIVQGMDYWKRFLKRFPTVQDLAAASEDEVMRLWEGLGYYSRARNLHAAAQQIVTLGAFPTTFCFGLPAAVVDGNVYRVLARHFGVETPVGTTAAKKEFTALAQRLLPPGEASAFNQGMMDFGALQCTPQNPDCLTCPMQASCHAFRTGRQGLLPVKKAAAQVQERHLSYVYVRFNGETAIRKRTAGDIWQGLWEPLRLPVGAGNDASHAASEKWFFAKPSEKYFSEDALQLLRKGVKHQLTHRTILADFYLWEPAERPELPEGYIWIQETELDRYGKPRLFEKLLEAIAGLGAP